MYFLYTLMLNFKCIYSYGSFYSYNFSNMGIQGNKHLFFTWDFKVCPRLIFLKYKICPRRLHFTLLFWWIAEENWSQKLLRLITSPSNFSISNFGKQTLTVSEIWKDKYWGNLFDSVFFVGFDKCKPILDIVSKYLTSRVRIWSSSFFEPFSFIYDNNCSLTPFILSILWLYSVLMSLVYLNE